MAAIRKKTGYAEELQRTEVGDTRLERLRILATGIEEIRLSWWPRGKFAPRPVDVTEATLVQILAQGVCNGTLSPQFIDNLKEAANAIR